MPWNDLQVYKFESQPKKGFFGSAQNMPKTGTSKKYLSNNYDEMPQILPVLK